MRCLSCNHNLSALTEHRCSECARVFDPDDPRTWSTRPRRLWPTWAVFLSSVFGFWLFLATVLSILFIYELPSVDTPYVKVFAGSLLYTFLPTFSISGLLLCGFYFGRRQSSS